MVAMWWITTVVVFLFLVFGVFFIIFKLRTSLNIHDSVKIDPIPEDLQTSTKK